MKICNSNDFQTLLLAINRIDKSARDWKILLRQLRTLINADFAVLVDQFPSIGYRGQIYHEGCDREHVAHYQCSLFKFDEAATKPFPKSFPRAEILDSKHPLHTKFLQPFGVKSGLIIDSLVDNRIAARLFLGRSASENPFSSNERHILDMLAPHLEQSIQQRGIFLALAEQSDVFCRTIDSLPLPTLLLGRNSCIFHESDKARPLFTSNGNFHKRHGKLEITLAGENFNLDKKINDLLLKSTHGRRESSDIFSLGNFQILLKPVSSTNEFTHNNYVAMFVFDVDTAPAPDHALLKKLFRFTNAETRLAMLLAQGQSIDEAKLVLGISKHTVRTHLRAMFVKAGVSRQASLVQKIVTSAAMLH